MCSVLAGETTNSIQNWTDIVPEADVKSHNDAMNEMKAELDMKTDDLKELETELQSAISQDEEHINTIEERDGLKTDLQEKEREIARLNRKLRRQQSKFWASTSDVSGEFFLTSKDIATIKSGDQSSTGITGRSDFTEPDKDDEND